MADSIVFWRPGADITGTATAAVTGRRFVAISGDKQADGTYSIAPAAAGGRAIGVAMQDAAIGGKTNVIRGAKTVAEVEAGAALTAFAEVESDATGRAVPRTTGVALGVVMTAQATVGAAAEVSLY